MKVLSGLILYIILFAVEYKKQCCGKRAAFKCRQKTAVLFISAVIFVFSAVPAFSYCSTVSACKIIDIKEELKQSEEIEKAINDYLDKKVIFYGIKKADYKNFNYDDLFIYRTAV